MLLNSSQENILIDEIKLEALYLHWVNHVDSRKYANDFVITAKPSESEFVKEVQLNLYFNRLVISHALLYVVIEGYKDLKLSDHNIDNLLSEIVYVDKLRLLRNALFHYQDDIRPTKLMEFIDLEGSAEWIKKLDKCFEKFFIENVNIVKMVEEIYDDTINNKNE
jgi:hypothetical protein